MEVLLHHLFEIIASVNLVSHVANSKMLHIFYYIIHVTEILGLGPFQSRFVPVKPNRKDIVKIFSGNLEGFLVQPLFLSLLGNKSQSSFMFSSMSLPFCKILYYKHNVSVKRI